MATYNVVTDLGADDTGSTAIDSAIENNATYGNTVASGNTLIFPPGDYLLNDLIVGSTVSNFTLQGEPGARLIPKDWGDQNASAWIHVQGSGFEWHGFEILVNGKNPGPVDIEADNWELTRLITRGQTHCETDGDVPEDSGVARTWFSLWVNSAGATGLLEDCYFADGSNQNVAAGSNRRAILIDGGQGDITINRCWLEHWGENTIYAKHPAGQLDIYNSYWRNTQNGARTGGNTEVWNCVSIMDGPIPKNWDGSALQRGVVYEADGSPTDADHNQYSGLNNIKECDFYHDYRSPPGEPDSCGAAIGGRSAPEFAEIHDCRIYYNSDRSHDAVYNGASTQGAPKRWALDNVHIDNDCSGDQFCIDVVANPDNWGPVSGELTAENNGKFVSGSNYVRDRMNLFGNPEPPDTTPPLPQPVSGTCPMGRSTVVTIDNTGADETSSYTFDGAPTGNTIDAGTVHPSGVGNSKIAMQWAGGHAGRRETSANGQVGPGKIHRYYIADGSLLEGSFSQSGDATLIVDGTTTSDITPAYRLSAGEWSDIPNGAVHGKAGMGVAQMKYKEAGEWKLAVDRS